MDETSCPEKSRYQDNIWPMELVENNCRLQLKEELKQEKWTSVEINNFYFFLKRTEMEMIKSKFS